MRTVLSAAASTALCAFVFAGPAFAQDTVTGAPPGEAPVTVEGYGNGTGQPGQPGIGTDYPYWASPNRTGAAPEYGYGWGGWFPFFPVGAAAGAVGSGMATAANDLSEGPVGAAPAAAHPLRRHHCHRGADGRRICAP